MIRLIEVGLLLFALVLNIRTNAQDILTLKDCIELAIENNVAVQQSKLDYNNAANTLLGTKADFLPNLNGNVSHRYNFGRAIDPTTNTFSNQQIRSNFLTLNSDLTLFNGLSKVNSYKQAELNLDASWANLQKTKDDIALNTANAYLNIINLLEQQKQVEIRLDNNRNQNINIQKQYNAGAVAEIRVLEIESLVAEEEANLVDIGNNIIDAYQNLKILMNYEVNKEFKIALIDAEIDVNNIYERNSLDSVLTSKVKNLPSYVSAVNTTLAQKKAYQISKANMYPTLTANFGLNTGYSTGAVELSNFSFQGFDTIGLVANTNQSVVQPRIVPEFVTTPASTQFENNFGQYLSFNLTVPIFNNLRIKNNIDFSRNQFILSELREKEVLNNLKADAIRAYNAMVAAESRFKATQKRLSIQKKLANQTQINFDNGVANFYELQAAKNQLATLESLFTTSKYQLLFQKKVFEFYLGIPLTSN